MATQNAFDNLNRRSQRFGRRVAGVFAMIGTTALLSGYLFQNHFRSYESGIITQNSNPTLESADSANIPLGLTDSPSTDTTHVAVASNNSQSANNQNKNNLVKINLPNKKNANTQNTNMQQFLRTNTFGQTLIRGGATPLDAYLATQAAQQIFPIASLSENQVVRLDFGQASNNQKYLNGFSVRLGDASELSVKRINDGSFTATINQLAVDNSLKLYRFRISEDGGFVASAQAAGLSTDDISNTANLLATSVDLARGIVKGDLVQILLDENTQAVKNDIGGNVRVILISSADGADKSFFYFTSKDGRASYYDNNGESQLKILVRTPIDGARITSGFGSRNQPLFGFNEFHHGVDFGAPIGTPVKAAGDGVVERLEWVNGYGNFLSIKHANGYSTAYAHLSGYLAGLHVGSKVTQNQVVAYVGNTGLSTGPHLHFEIHVNNAPVNPSTVKLDALYVLKSNDLIKFQNTKRDALARIQNAQIVVEK